jgi:drug/metabolite transporter (DMT)-like permease
MIIGRWLPSYLLVVLLWGGAYGITEIALTAFSPGQVAMWRALIGAACLAVILVAGGGGLPRLGKAGWCRIAVLAGLTTIASVSATTAQCRMPSAIVAVLCAMTPLFAAIFCHLRRVPTPATGWLGVGLGVIGVAALLSPSGNVDDIGVILGLTAAACFALSGALAAAFFPGSTHSGSKLTMAQLLCSGLLLVPVTPVTGLSLSPSGPLAAVLILGVFAAAVGNVLFWRVLRQAGPVVAATTYQTVPLVAVLVGIVILGEPFGIGEYLGTAFILAGLALQLVVPAANDRPDAGPGRRSPASPADRALQPAVARS